MGLPSHWTTGLCDDIWLHNKYLDGEIHQLVSDAESKKLPTPQRITAGVLLGLIGDPRIRPLDPPMVNLDSALVYIGTVEADLDNIEEDCRSLGVKRAWIEKECPRHCVNIEKFRIGKFPVTNFEYRAFLSENLDQEIPLYWKFGGFPFWAANHPVYGITHLAAKMYARWLSKKTSRLFRLPSEAEWEYAAAGLEGRCYPWGGAFLYDYANTVEMNILGTTPVGCFPMGNTPQGISDMAGNVEEYVEETYYPYPGGRIIHDDVYSSNPHYAMTRGGSFCRFRDLARCRRRHGYINREIYPIGFRLAESV